MWKAKSTLALALLLAVACKSSRPAEETPPTDASAQSPNGAAMPDAQDAPKLASDQERLALSDQRTKFLLEAYLENAQRLMSELKLAEAKAEVDRALELDADSVRAKTLRAEIQALQGDKVSEAQTIGQELGREYELRVQALKAEAQDGLAKAKLMIARNDYRGAIAELELVNNMIRYAPYSVRWDGVDAEAKSLLASARASRESAEQAAREAAERKATEALRAEAQAERSRRDAQVANTLDRAISAFQRADYEESESLAKLALAKDPQNERAQEIKDAAFRVGRTKVREEYVEKKREQFRRWQESMKDLQIPWTDVITLPDSEQWNKITSERAKRRGVAFVIQTTDAERTLREELRTVTVQIPAIAEEESLTKVVDVLRLLTGLPLIVDPAAEASARTDGIVFNFSFENKLTVEQALNLITGMAGENVTWTIRHDAVLITTKEKARGKPVIVNHDVQDLVFGLTDFSGPRIDRLRLLDQMQDDDGGGPFGGIGEKPKLIEPDALATLIQENVAVGTWQDEGVSIEAAEGYILITHTSEVQGFVRQFLEDLRRFASSLVTIESKFLTVSSNWIQEIGVDLRGLDNADVTDVTNGLEDMASRGLDNGGTGTTGQNAAGHPSTGVFYNDGGDGDYRATTQNYFATPLGNAISTVGGLSFQLTYLNDINLSAILRAVEKSNNLELVNDQVLSVHNTQRAYVAVINQRAYIQDFDVEVAQFQAVADPQINVLNEGVVLDVRPTIHHDRKYLTLEIQPTVAKVVALRNFSTTLGGQTSPVEFQLPELEVESVFTTAIIPDGGSIMLGGLSNVRNIERRAEVPWVANIPIVGFLFKQEGYNDENRSLMILIRARITDVREELRKLEAR